MEPSGATVNNGKSRAAPITQLLAGFSGESRLLHGLQRRFRPRDLDYAANERDHIMSLLATQVCAAVKLYNNRDPNESSQGTMTFCMPK